MQMFQSRVVALLLGLFVSFPGFVHAAADPAARPPLAWLAVHSYQRVEQRLREFAELTQVPGLTDIALGLVQLQFAGLRGLDRQRPLGVLVPTLTPTAEPILVLRLPYTDKEALMSTLQIFFPQITTRDGVLVLQGESVSAFGRLDEQATTLHLAETPEALEAPAPGLSAAVFGASPDSPDVVLHLDVDTARQRHPALWQSLLASMAKARETARQTAEQEATTLAEQAFLAAYFAFADRQLQQFLLDLSRAEFRVTLHPKGWSTALEARLRPGSTTAAFFNHQRQHRSRATQLFADDAAARFVSSYALTPGSRRELVTLLHLGARAAEARLSAETSPPPASPPTDTTGLGSLTRFFEQWLAEDVIEIAAELRLQPDSGPALTAWMPMAEAPQRLDLLLEALGKIVVVAGHEVVMTRNAVQHNGASLHRLEFPAAQGSDVPLNTVYLSARSGMLMAHTGASHAPLVQLLDRLDTLATQPPLHFDTLQRFEVVPIHLLAAGLGVGMSPDTPEGAIIAQILQGSDEPIRLEVRAHDHAVVQHFVLPSSYIQGLAGLMGQQLLESIRQSLLGQ